MSALPTRVERPAHAARRSRSREPSVRCANACFIPSFAGLVVVAGSLNPIPSRTRPLNFPAPMVVRLKTRESRSLPGLPRTEFLLHDIEHKNRRGFFRGGFFMPGSILCLQSGRPDPSEEHRGSVRVLALGLGLSQPSFCERGKLCRERIGIDLGWIEGASDPFVEFGVAFVFGVVDGFQELGVAPGAANVLERAAAAGLEQTWVDNARLRVEQAFDFDRVFPVVAKVVEVFQRLCADVLDHIVEMRLACIEGTLARVAIWDTPSGIWDTPSGMTGSDL